MARGTTRRTIKKPTITGSLSLTEARRVADVLSTKSASPKSKSATKRKPGAIAMKAVTPSAELAAVVGHKALPRAEITKRIWDYIKKNKLQDSVNKRMINADAKLQPIFGGKKRISIFEVTAFDVRVRKHAR